MFRTSREGAIIIMTAVAIDHMVTNTNLNPPFNFVLRNLFSGLTCWTRSSATDCFSRGFELKRLSENGMKHFQVVGEYR